MPRLKQAGREADDSYANAVFDRLFGDRDPVKQLKAKGKMWQAAGCDVVEVDHNWRHSVYTTDPTGNVIEFCLTTGEFSEDDRAEALAALNMDTFKASPPPSLVRRHEGQK